MTGVVSLISFISPCNSDVKGEAGKEMLKLKTDSPSGLESVFYVEHVFQSSFRVQVIIQIVLISGV